MRLLPPGIAVSILLAACGGRVGEGEGAAPASPAERGLVALEARADFNGAPLPARIDGQPTVVVVFASWCGPCRKELASLGRLRESQPNMRVIGLNAYEEFDNFSDENRLRRFLAQTAPWLPVVREDGTLLRAFGGVPRIPTMFIFDHSGGIVREFRRGERALPTAAELVASLEAARAR